MSKKISVIIKEPGKNPRHVAISDSPRNLQATVGGEVDEILISSDLVILINKNQSELPECCEVCSRKLSGTIVFCGIGHPDEDAADELTDIPVSFQEFKKLFPDLWEKGGKA